MKDFFEKSTMLLILFPYIKIGFDFGTDVQPLYFISGLFLLFLMIFGKAKIKIYNIFLFAILVTMIINTFFLFMFSDTFERDFFGYFRSLYKYLAFLLLFLIHERIDRNLKASLLFFATIVYFLVSNFQMIFRDPIVPFLLSRASYDPNRNLAIGLTPEASFLAKFSLSMILLADYMMAKGEMNKRTYVAISLMNIEMILISLSLSGIFLLIAYVVINLILYLIIRIKFTNVLKLCLTLFFLLLILLPLEPYIQKFLSTGRIGMFYNYIVSGDIVSFFQEDPSFQGRVNVIKLTFNSLVNHPFGQLSPYPLGGFTAFIYENGVYGMLFVAYYLYSFLRMLPHLKHQETRMIRFILTAYFIVPLLIFVDTLSVSYFIVLLNIMFYNSSRIARNSAMETVRSDYALANY